jgi:S1-C subfamily serine protease
MSTLEAVEADRNLRRRRFAMATLAVLALAGIGLAVVAVRDVQEERSARGAAVQRLQGQLAQAEQRALALQARTAALQSENRGFLKRIGALQRSLDASRTDLAPLASRILRSVFVVVTPTGFGTGWAAWRADGETYLITANHVAQDAVARGTHQVTIDQKGRSWPGVIVATDSVNDLAVIRVANLDAPPLWQAPDTRRVVVAGDRILLVGSPFGLEGTVTSGVVSRVGKDRIVTDAAANPGNSGGPAVDTNGQVVGVLLSDVGTDLSFLVPIQRACVTVRECP